MAQTVTQLQTQLAYRLGETSAPSDSTTKAQRLEWLNQGYFEVARNRNWWWLEGSDTNNTNTGSTTGYAEPSDLKEFIELKIGTAYYDQIPYNDNRIYTGTSAIVSLPTTIRSFKFYRFGGRYYLIPEDDADSTAHTIKYWKRVTKRSADGDTFLIPDEYLEILPAHAEYKYWLSITQTDKAQAALAEFQRTLQQMMAEQGRRGWGSYGFDILDPDQVYP